MDYGWVLPQSVKDDLLQRAETRGLVQNATIIAGPDLGLNIPDSDRNPDIKNEVIHFVNRPLTMELVVDALIKDLGIRIPALQFINLVFTKSDRNGAFCLTLYTNYARTLPTDKGVEKLAAELGLTDRSYWHPHGIRFQWGPRR